jgi:hypothetical protein
MVLRNLAIVIFSILLLATGCTVNTTSGGAALPKGIETARIPQSANGGFLYFASEPPLTLKTDLLLDEATAAEVVTAPVDVRIREATIVLGTSLNEFAGSLRFASEDDAIIAQSVLSQDSTDALPEVSDTLPFTSAQSEWGESTVAAYNSGDLVALPEQDPAAWALLTHLPSQPPSPPAAVGVLKLSHGVLEDISEQAGLVMADVGDAYKFVRADNIGFGIYSAEPVNVAVRIDQEYLAQSGADLLFVSQSGYPAGLVAFMLSVIGNKTQMELVEFGSTNARYRQLGDLHLVLKNDGTLIYAALSGSREDAEALILSAIGN